MAELLYLTRREVEGLGLTVRDMTGRLRKLLKGAAAGTARNTPKRAINRADGRLYMSMLASADDPPRFATKSLGLSPANAERGLPSIGALICLHDSETGQPIAVMDGDWITGVRTAALSALAAEEMAREDAAVIAFVGAGVQARCHLELFAQMFPLAEVRILGRGRANIDRLAEMARGMELTVVEPADAEAGLRGADIVVSSVTPTPDLPRFLSPEWLSPGAFVTAVELARAWDVDRLAGRARVVVDDAAQEREMEDPLVPPALIAGDLAGLATGATPGRGSSTGVEFFAFRGLAMGDLALATLCAERAEAAGVGTRLPR